MMGENAVDWTPPVGWTYQKLRQVSHACGWSFTAPLHEPWRLSAAVAAHDKTCPWPDTPEPVETVSD